MNSPVMKAFGDQQVAAGQRLLVVDLAKCSGMDSTFMGTLAGMASRLSAMDGGALQIAESGERNRRSLEDLGLDFLMEINPPAATWCDKLEAIRSDLKPPHAAGSLGQIQRTKHVLEAHQVLSTLSDKNALAFGDVVGMLEEQISETEIAVDKHSKD